MYLFKGHMGQQFPNGPNIRFGAHEGKRTLERRLGLAHEGLGLAHAPPSLAQPPPLHLDGGGKGCPLTPYIKRPPRREENTPGPWLPLSSPSLFFLRSSLLEHARG